MKITERYYKDLSYKRNGDHFELKEGDGYVRFLISGQFEFIDGLLYCFHDHDDNDDPLYVALDRLSHSLGLG